MTYVDGFVVAVPAANKDAFIAHARHADAIFKELGALRVVEAWADDVPEGKITDFYRAVQAKADEVVVFSWVAWPDKARRDKALERMHEMAKTDPRFDEKQFPVPYDGMRMIYGGFSVVLEL